MFVASIIAVGLIALGAYQLIPQEEDNGSATAVSDSGDSADTGGTNGSSGGFQAPAAGAVMVNAEPAHRGELIMRIDANGVAEAQRLLRVGAEVEGKIENITVEEGDWVDAGDLLVEIDDTELVMQRDRAAENYLSQIMSYSNNQIALSGVNNDDSSAGTPGENALEFLRRYINSQAFQTMLRQPDLEERLSELTREDLFAALAQLTNQRVALEQAEINLARTRITAPFSGQVAGIEASSGPNSKSWPVVGQQVGSGTDLMMLVDPDPIRVRVEVIESEISLVREGRRAAVTFQAFPGETFNGVVEAIDPVVDADRKTLSVTVRLPNADHRIKPGMFAQVTLDAQIFEDRLLVPVEAVLLRDNRHVVFVVKDGRAQWEYVTIGYQNDDWIEILSDNVHEGDVIVTSGHFTLAHDVPVNVIEPEQSDAGS
jgi:HlyD family secretion protein